MIALDALVAALKRLPELAEVEAADLFGIEKRAFSVSGSAGYKKTTLFLIAMLFDRLARHTEGEEPKPGRMYSAICESAISALRVDGWTDGAQKLEELVALSWQSEPAH